MSGATDIYQAFSPGIFENKENIPGVCLCFRISNLILDHGHSIFLQYIRRLSHHADSRGGNSRGPATSITMSVRSTFNAVSPDRFFDPGFVLCCCLPV